MTLFQIKRALGVALWCSISLFDLTDRAYASKIPLTVLHTNDLHSHFRPQKGPINLGGIARIATEVERQRQIKKNTILVDGGDWSEGHVYFRADAGRAALEIMNSIGYDAVVVGNHDFLNGADHLLNIFKDVPPSFKILAANLDLSQYPRAKELSEQVSPFTIKEIGGIQVGIIGLSTYELIYDQWFAPVKITEPFKQARELSKFLKEEKKVQLVMVLSHNNLATNKVVAAMPYVDVVIHSHDHLKLARPLVVERNGKKAWIVEAHQWGNYLGVLDLIFDTDSQIPSLSNYELIQMDETVSSDPSIALKVEEFEAKMAKEQGDFFNTKHGTLPIDLRREFRDESPLLNFITDAYKEETQSSIAFEQIAFTGNELYAGAVTSADLFDVLPFIYSPYKKSSWTLKTAQMTGETISWLMNFLLSAQNFVDRGVIAVSGLRVVYDRFTSTPEQTVSLELKKLSNQDLSALSRSIKLIEVGGRALQKNKYYQVALPDGVLETIRFFEDNFRLKLDIKNIVDTNIENWRVVANYLEKNSPLSRGMVSRGRRIVVMQPDISVNYEDTLLMRNKSWVDGYIEVHNVGSTVSSPRWLNVGYDKTPNYYVDDPAPEYPNLNRFQVPSLKPGESRRISIMLSLPSDFANKRVPLYFRLNDLKEDPVESNDVTWIVSYPDSNQSVINNELNLQVPF